LNVFLPLIQQKLVVGHAFYQLPTISHPQDVSLNSKISEAMTGLLAPDFSSNKGERAGRAWSCILWLYKSQRRETREGRNNTAITKRKHTDREQNTERTEKKEKQREDRQSKLRGRENWREKQKQRDQKKKRQKAERRPKTEASPSDKHL